MSAYFLAALLLSGAAFIHGKSEAPEMRPANRLMDRVWLVLGKGAFLAWILLLLWGFRQYHWSQPVAAFIGSIAVNAFIAHRGPRPAWPGLSMLLAVVGFGLAAAAVWG